MRVTYDMIWIKRAKTPGLMRARVFERGMTNSLDRMVGRKDYNREREWIGCERWFETGNLKVRAPKQLENFLSAKTHYIDNIEEVTKCQLPALTITFGRKPEFACGRR